MSENLQDRNARNSANACKELLNLTFFFFFCFFLEAHLQHKEIPRLGVERELLLLAYTTATKDTGHICDLHHSSGQCQILNPLSKARD